MVEQRHEIVLNFVTNLISEGIDQLNAKLDKVRYTITANGEAIGSFTQKFDAAGAAIDANARKQETLTQVAKKFNVSLFEAERSLSSVGIAFDEAGRPIDAVSNKLLSMEEVLSRARTRLVRFRAEFLSIMFGMQMLNRALKNFIKSAIAAYEKAFQKQSDFAKATAKLRAAWEFFKFALIDALARSTLFRGLVDFLFEAVNWINELITARPELAQWFALGILIGIIVTSLFAAYSATILLIYGLWKAGVIGSLSFTSLLGLFGKFLLVLAIIGLALWGIIDIIKGIHDKHIPQLIAGIAKLGVAFSALAVSAKLLGIKILAGLGPIGWIILAISVVVWFLALNWKKAWLGMLTIAYFFVSGFFKIAEAIVWVADKIVAAFTFGKVRLTDTIKDLHDKASFYFNKTKESMEEFSRIPIKLPIIDELGLFKKTTEDTAKTTEESAWKVQEQAPSFLNFGSTVDLVNTQLKDSFAKVDQQLIITQQSFQNLQFGATQNLNTLTTQIQSQMPLNIAQFSTLDLTLQKNILSTQNLTTRISTQLIPSYQNLNLVLQANLILMQMQITWIAKVISSLDREISKVTTLIRKYKELAAAKREAGAGGGGIVGAIRSVIGLQKGGYIERSGLFYLHAGETVIPKGAHPSVTIGAININVSGAYVEPTKLAKEIKEELEKELLRSVGSALR